MKTWGCLLILAAIGAGCSKPAASVTAVSNAADEEDQPVDPYEVFFLGKSPGVYVPTPEKQDRGLLAREFFRQALLIAARDELGLVTRDAWLGDYIRPKEEIRPFELATQGDAGSRLAVLYGFSYSLKEIGAVELAVVPPDHYQKRLWTEAEKLSRGNFVAILEQLVGRRQPLQAWTPDLALPGAIEKSLREMTFLAQFKAARQIHDLIAARGSSPALLGALVRAYANLGILTEFHWDPAHKVFKARAILYAQRWLSRQPDCLPALWHRAYALTLAGDHAEALEDLQSAEKAWQATAEKERPSRPGWVALLNDCCRYNIAGLAAERNHPEHGQLAALVHYHTVELAGNQRWALETAATTLQKIPNCLRVHDGVAGFGGVSTGHLATLAPIQVLGRTLYRQVDEMPGLPESVRQQMKRSAEEQATFGRDLDSMGPEFKARKQLMTALRAASRPAAYDVADARQGAKSAERNDHVVAPGASRPARPPDSGEPSWAALAHLIHDVSFVHVWRRTSFLQNELGVPPGSFGSIASPLIFDHPLYPFMATLTSDVVSQRKAVEQAAQVEPDALEAHADSLFSAFDRAALESAKRCVTAMEEHRDGLARDYVALGRAFEKDLKRLDRYARSLLRCSPHSPLARAYLINADAASKAEIAEWKKLAPQYPALARALARHHAKAKQWDDAERYCQAALKIVGDSDIYKFLADVYAAKGDEDRWLQTLEAVLRQPDYGLEHASVQSDIAWHFMHKRQWKRALPYATGAAESYSGWGLLCAAACHEGLQEWDKAEEYLHAAADRYGAACIEWYFFCRRTGHGDLAAARGFAQTRLEANLPRSAGTLRNSAFKFYVLDKQPDDALQIYKETFVKRADPASGLWVALLADELKSTGTRDEALARIRTDGPSVIQEDTGKARKELIQLAAWIESDLAHGGKGEIDLEAVEKFRAEMAGSRDLAYFDLFLARYLQSRGKREAAIRYWKQRVASTDIQHFVRTVAGAALCDLGIKPESYKALLESDPKAGVQADPKADVKAAPEAKELGKEPGKKESNNDGKSAGAEPAQTTTQSDAKHVAGWAPTRLLGYLRYRSGRMSASESPNASSE